MVAILLTFREGPKGIVLESNAISKPDQETPNEKAFAIAVDCGIKAAQTVIMSAISAPDFPAIQIEGKDIEALSARMMRDTHMKPILEVLRASGYDV